MPSIRRQKIRIILEWSHWMRLFAGVDDKNISSMFELVQKLDFDYIMNSPVSMGML